MLSDDPKTSKLPSPSSRGVRSGWYPDSVKQDALKLWLVTGNLSQVSTSMNIPYDTLKVWRHSKWWAELSQEIRTEGHLALSAKMQKIADKAMTETLDRLENGEPVVIQKTGEIVNKPVSMRDAHQVAVSFQDRALKLQNSPSDEAAQLAVHDRLTQLAEAFAKMAGTQKKKEVIDVAFTEHEEVQPQEIGYQPEEADASPEDEVLDDLPQSGGGEDPSGSEPLSQERSV
jgi:hypothetical protein